jgi:hypothetical protein
MPEIDLADGSKVEVSVVQPPGAAPMTAAGALDQWLDAHVRNSAYSQNTLVWNAIQAAFQQIKTALAIVDGG